MKFTDLSIIPSDRHIVNNNNSKDSRGSFNIVRSKKQDENDRYLIARGSLSIKQQLFISVTETVTFTRYQTFC